MYDVIVIGAGLAGSAVAVHLASRGHTVLLLEKHFYPIHKLCGEFLSGESQAYLLRLGVLEAVQASGAQRIARAQLTTSKGRQFSIRLQQHGIGISRYVLDHMLLVRAVAAGVEVRQGLNAREIRGDLERGFEVASDAGLFRSRVVIGAYGRRSQLDRKLGREFLSASRPYVAFKAHYQGFAPTDTVELHAFSGGYCGLCPVGGDVVNACWIGHEEMLKTAGGDPEAMLMRIQLENRMLGERLLGLERIPASYLAASQLYFRAKGAISQDVVLVGDAAGLIAPMCGDGMSMALRSSELLVPYVDRFLKGRLEADLFRRRYARRWRLEFGPRMQLGRWLHEGFSTPRAADVGMRVVRTVPPLGRLLLTATRG